MQHDRHAVVLGGGMAGLLAAAVLSETFAQVTVLDRDDLSVPGERRGVPQGKHIHALLTRGQQQLEELLPGWTAELVARGAPQFDMLADTRLHFNGHRFRPGPSGLQAVSASRALLEQHTRERVRVLPGVRLSPPCDVTGLTTTADRSRVTGVRILRRSDGSTEEVLSADLVIDAMGRGSRTPVWLDVLGYQRAAEERVRVDLGYATLRFRLPPGALDGSMVSLHGPTPDNPRGGALSRIENDVWMLTLMGRAGVRPPTDPAGFADYAGLLSEPDIRDAIRHAQPVGDLAAFRFPVAVRRRYERLTRFPDSLLVMGDAVCSFNPVYGQGITVAALEARALRRHTTPRSFHRAAARIVDAPWLLATGGDFAFPGVQGRRPAGVGVINAYVRRLQAAAAHDARLGTTVLRVSSLVDPPGRLLHPATVARVLLARRSGREAREALGETPGVSRPRAR